MALLVRENEVEIKLSFSFHFVHSYYVKHWNENKFFLYLFHKMTNSANPDSLLISTEVAQLSATSIHERSLSTEDSAVLQIYF